MTIHRIRVSPSGPVEEIDVPDLPISSDDVTDESNVTSGGTVTQALNALLAMSGGAISPLSRVLYTDGASVVVGTEDGSIAHPFKTLTAAMAAAQPLVAAGVDTTILLVPFDYTGEAQIIFEVNLGGLAFVALQVYNAQSPDQGRQHVRPTLPDFDFQSRNGTLTFVGCELVHDVQYGTAVPFGGSLLIKDCDSTGAGASAVGYRIEHTRIGSTLFFQGDAQECTFIDVDFTRGDGTIIASASGNVPMYLEDCTFSTGGPNGPEIEFAGLPGTVSMDEATAYNFQQAGGFITNGSLVVRSAKGYGFKLTTVPSGAFTNDTNWQNVPSSPAQFGAELGSGWTLDTATGEATYNGLPRLFLLTCSTTIFRNDPLQARAAISINDDVPTGNGTEYDHEQVNVTDSSTGGKSSVTLQRPAQLESGDVVQVRYRNGNSTGSSGMVIHTLCASFIPIG